MAANSKSELREVAEKEFGKLMKIVGSIDAAVALKKRDEDTSIKDRHRPSPIARIGLS